MRDFVILKGLVYFIGGEVFKEYDVFVVYMFELELRWLGVLCWMVKGKVCLGVDEEGNGF